MAEARFSLPDGRTGTLRGESMDDIRAEAERLGATLESPGTSFEAFGQAAIARALNAASNLGAAQFNNQVRPAANALLESLSRPAGIPLPARPAANALLESLSRSAGIPLPALLGASPPQIPPVSYPSGQDLAAGLETPMQAVMAGQSLADAFQTRVSERQQLAEARPVATLVGELAADVGMIVGARRPFRAPGGGGAFDNLAQRGAEALGRFANPGSSTTGARALASLASKPLGTLLRGLGRVGEAGIEGAATSVLQGGNTADLALAGAAAQTAGSLGNTVLDAMVGPSGRRSLSRAIASVATGTALLQFIKEAPIFDEDGTGSILDSAEDNFDKVVSVVGLGFVSGLMGRRGTANGGSVGRYLPDLADGMSTLPRAGIFEIVREAESDPAIERAMTNVPALGESDARRFMEILEGDAPAEGLRDWMDSNERVRRILSAPDPRLAQTPVREDSDG